MDAFEAATGPQEYLKASSLIHERLLSTHSPYDISTAAFFDVSPMTDLADPVSLHFLVQAAIADSKGAKLCSFNEVGDLKTQLRTMHAQVAELEKQLSLEYKMRDAALSLTRLSKSRSSVSVTDEQNDSSESGDGAGKQPRRSFIFGNSTKRESRDSLQSTDDKSRPRDARTELDRSSERIIELQKQLCNLNQQVSATETHLLQHSLGILALTHQSSGSGSARTLEKYVTDSENATDEKNDNDNSSHAGNKHKQTSVSRNASSRMLQAHSRSASSQRSMDNSAIDTVDELIGRLSEALSDRTTSIGPPPQGEALRLKCLSDLATSLASRYETAKVALDRAEAEMSRHQAIMTQVHDEVGVDMDTDTEKSGIPIVVQKIRDLKATRSLSRSLTPPSSSSASPSQEPVADGSKVKTILKRQLDSVTESYEKNRGDLERLELENLDLKTSLRETRFAAQAEMQAVRNELASSEERVQEWRERCETLQKELESVVVSLEDVTRQAVEEESEREKLEARVRELEDCRDSDRRSHLDKRVSQISVRDLSPVKGRSELSALQENTSVTLLRHEFRAIVQELNSKHMRELRREQAEKKKLQSLLRSLKSSSFSARSNM